MNQEPTENDSVGYHERTATIIVKDDGSKCVEVGMAYEHDDEEVQYILHKMLNAMGRIEMDISCDRKGTVEAFIEDQKKPTFLIRKNG